MKNVKLPFRQIHLDFHTSEHLKNIGRDFDKDSFQQCLQLGHVNSVTSFATCHHGWAYYDSKVCDMHPNMKEPLLPKMIEAANEIGVQTPIYLTVGWNERIGRLHPEWVVKKKDGSICSVRDTSSGVRKGWMRICLNTPYLEELVNQTAEVMDRFNPVGLFYDIVWEKPCYCESCMESMLKRGIDVKDDAAVFKFAREVYVNYFKTITEVIWSKNPNTRVYHNGKDKKGRDDTKPYYSHHEIESLPTTSWCGGYESFPQKARYYKYKVSEFLGMTGKFHQSWGEFGGYKSSDALRFEAMRMIMYGGKCSVGDQMLPEGTLDLDTYKRIGEAYATVEEKEPWCDDIKNIAEIAVLCPSAIMKNVELEDPEIGASMILSENHMLYDMVDQQADLLKYKLLILPDEVVILPDLKVKLDAFLKNGGALIASGKSGFSQENQTFNLDYGVEYGGESEWYIDFTKVSEAISKNMVKAPYFNFLPGPKLKLTSATVLADTIAPHFNRTLKTFCSHGNTPPGPDAGYPSVIQNGNIIYIGPKVFSMYRKKGMKLHRDLVRNCIDLLLPKKSIHVDLPSGAQIALNEQSNGNKVLHILYANPIMRGEVPVIEDILPLYDLSISLKTKSVDFVRMVPENKDLVFEFNEGICSFTIPKIELHQMVSIGSNG